MEGKEILSIIGKRLKNRRLELKLTQAQLSYLVDTDPSYIRKVEKGKVNISVKRLYKITEALNITLSDLLKSLD